MTDEQLTAAFESLRRDVQQSEERIRRDMLAAIQQSEERTIEAARKMQDEILRGLRHMTERYDIRLRHLEANAGNLETAERLRLAILEERVSAIETKLRMIPGEPGTV